MKKFLSAFITFILVFTLSTFESAGDDPIVPFIQFSSLDDFLNAYLIAKEGGDIEDFVEREFSFNNIGFVELEILHLPIVIPENFVIRRIIVNEYSISVWFLPEGVEGATNAFWQSWNQYPHFWLSVSYHPYFEHTMEAVLRNNGQTIDDLIDGIYSFRSVWNSYVMFNWVSDGKSLSLYVNLQQQNTEEFEALFGDGEVLELVRFAETAVVDLTDEEDIKVLLSGSGVRYRKGDVNGDGKIDTADALEILKNEAGLSNIISGNDRAFAAADVNGDGRIDTEDALLILRIAAGLET